MRKRSLILIAVLAYVVALALTLPAVQALRFADTAPAQLAGVHGTFWRGGARQVVVQDFVIDDVRWRLLPLKLFTGELAAALEARYAGGPAAATVALDWRRELHVRALDYRLDARRLVDFMPLPIVEFSGDIDTRVEQLTLSEGALQRIDGKVLWKAASLTAPFATRLGDYRLDLQSTERGHRAQLDGSGGALNAQGELTLQRDGRFVADLTFRPTRSAPPELVEQLDFLARKQRNGDYVLRRNGRLQDFW